MTPTSWPTSPSHFGCRFLGICPWANGSQTHVSLAPNLVGHILRMVATRGVLGVVRPIARFRWAARKHICPRVRRCVSKHPPRCRASRCYAKHLFVSVYMCDRQAARHVVLVQSPARQDVSLLCCLDGEHNTSNRNDCLGGEASQVSRALWGAENAHASDEREQEPRKWPSPTSPSAEKEVITAFHCGGPILNPMRCDRTSRRKASGEVHWREAAEQ